MTQTNDSLLREWDFIVVGTGIGGATLGYSLARSGKSVLFCEKGHSTLENLDSLRGNYAEAFLSEKGGAATTTREILSRAGRWSEEIEDCSQDKPRRHVPFIGTGTGGSSALYGMAMERFHPADLSPRRNHPDATATTLPNSWPIDYEDLLPYYTAAEQLYRVKGTIDPLRTQETSGLLGPPPTPLHPANQELYDFFLAKGLHPYRLPMACEYLPDCQDCQGYLCARACKNDSTRICLEPAVRQYGARLLDQCDIIKLEATGDRVSGVICNWRGSLHTLRAKTVILAAGALQTPRILLNSISDAWPQGLANDSGLVGRNLMRHCIDLYAIFPRARDQLGGNLKQLGFNDLYQPPDQHLGTVQSFGRLPPAAVMVEQLEQELREGPWPTAARLFKPLKSLLRPALGGLFSRSIILATILEDMPCRDNRVMPGDRGLILNYRLHPYDRSRIRHFRQTMRGILKPYRHLLLKQAENNQRIAHACGTCRFGTDPRESVLAPTNRAHALANLYVVDSSFFPSSGATNPSLTIAANALRVADHLSS